MHEFFNRNYEINQFFKALSIASAFNMHFRFFFWFPASFSFYVRLIEKGHKQIITLYSITG